jgi:hypothetical protein
MISRKDIIEGLVNMGVGQTDMKCCTALNKRTNHWLQDAYFKATGHIVLIHDSNLFLPL